MPNIPKRKSEKQFLKINASFIAVHLKLIPAGRFKVFIAISSFANSTSQLAWPSITTIAATCGINRRTAIRDINALIKSGYLIRDAKGRKGESTRYRIIIPPSGPHATTPIVVCTPHEQMNKKENKPNANTPQTWFNSAFPDIHAKTVAADRAFSKIPKFEDDFD